MLPDHAVDPGAVNLRDMGLGVLVATVWGVNFVVIDAGLAGVPPLFFAAIRFALVAMLAVVVPRPRCAWRWVVLVGLFMSAGQFGLLYVALAAGMPPGTASLVLQVQVPLTILLAAAAFRERITPRRLLGIVVALIGLGVVAVGRGTAVPLIGLGLTIAAATSWAVGNVVSRRAAAGGLSMVVWAAVVVPAPLLAVSAVLEGPTAWKGAVDAWGWTQTWSTAFTVVIATVVGFGLWNALLARYPASSVVPFALLVPVVGIASAWIFQGRAPSPGTILGGVVLLLGAALALAPARPAAEGSERSALVGRDGSFSSNEIAALRVPPSDR